jgi:hypothetical protein
MSLLGQTLILYLLTGAGVAAAVYLRADAPGRLERFFRVVTAVAFWPLYVPLLLARGGDGRRPEPGTSEEAPRDDLAAVVAQAEAELKAALAGVAGWADEALAREGPRLRRLPAAWALQAERIRAMDRLLALPEGAPAPDPAPDGIVPPELAGAVRAPGVSDRLRHSLEVRRRNRERLRLVRRRAHDDLMNSLAVVGELGSMLELARFTGAPPARAAELLAGMAAACDGLAEVSWEAEPSASAGGST